MWWGGSEAGKGVMASIHSRKGHKVTGYPFCHCGMSVGGGGLGTCCVPLTRGVPDEGLAFPRARQKDASPLCPLALHKPSSEGHIIVLMSDGLGSPSVQRRMCVL